MARKRLALEIAALIAVLAVAAALRFYRLLDFPPGFHFDEAIDLKIARDVLGGARPLYTPEGWGREALYYYLVAPMLRLIDYNPLALRATAAARRRPGWPWPCGPFGPPASASATSRWRCYWGWRRGPFGELRMTNYEFRMEKQAGEQGSKGAGEMYRCPLTH